INDLEDVFGLARDFGLNKELFARQSFDGAAEPLERLVSLGAIEIGDALVISVMHQAVEAFAAQFKLDLAAITAGAHAQAAEFDSSLPERDLVHGRALDRGRSEGGRAGGPDHDRAGGGEGGVEEVPSAKAFHSHRILLQ